jgi:Cu/Ag efflux pump CusA
MGNPSAPAAESSGLLRRVIALSLQYRVLLIGLVTVLVVVGVVTLPRASVDVYPEFSPVEVQIQADALGLSAAEVEQLVTVPLEQDLLNGVAWLDQIQSESAPGLSTIDMIFKPGTDVLHARQQVQERMTQAHALPNVGSPPVMVQPVSSSGRVMMIGLSAKHMSTVDLSTLARWKIKPRLTGIPGVANVVIWGQRDRQLQVQVDPQKLRADGVTMDQVVSTTGNALWVSSLNFLEASTPGTGGFIDTTNQRFGVQHVFPITRPADLSSVTIADTGDRTVRLSDVADVVEGHQPLIGDAIVGRDPGLMMVIQKFPGANTREITKSVDDALAAMRPGLSGVTIDTHVFRPASYISSALHNVGLWALIGTILLIALLIAFVRSWRVALIGLVSILLSLIAAMSVLFLRGVTFNVMVLAGLTAALSALCAEGSRVAAPDNTDGSIGDAARQELHVLRARDAVYGWLILVLATVPIYLLGGIGGAFGKPFVIAYVLALTASLVVTLTVTPALTSLLLPHGRPPRSGRLEGATRRIVHRTVPTVLLRPRWAVAGLAVLTASCVFVIPQLHSKGLIPPPRDRELVVPIETAPGTSLAEMTRITGTMAAELRGLPGVADVGGHVGRGITGDQVVDVNAGELWVTLSPSTDYDQTVAAVRDTIGGYPGVRGNVTTVEQSQLQAVPTRTGSNAPLVVRVYGIDLSQLQATAARVQRAIADVPGVVRPTVEPIPEEPGIAVKVDLATAERYGIKPGDIRRDSATFFAGLPVGSIYQQQQIFDVVVWGTPTGRAVPTDVANLLIDTPSGDHVRLGDVAQVNIVPYPTLVRHDQTSRYVDVTAGTSGQDLPAVMAAVQSKVTSLPMPVEFHAEVLSDVADTQAQDLRTLWIVLAVLVGMLLLLHAAFESWRLAGLLLAMTPAACVLGALVAPLGGGVMSLGGLIGLLMVFGFTVRNGVMLIGELQRRGSTDLLAVVRNQSGPVLLSALLVGSLMLPILVLGDIAGLEILRPLAVVVLGGLVSSTLVLLYALPALYERLVPDGFVPEVGEPDDSHH